MAIHLNCQVFYLLWSMRANGKCKWNSMSKRQVNYLISHRCTRRRNSIGIRETRARASWREGEIHYEPWMMVFCFSAIRVLSSLTSMYVERRIDFTLSDEEAKWWTSCFDPTLQLTIYVPTYLQLESQFLILLLLLLSFFQLFRSKPTESRERDREREKVVHFSSIHLESEC